MDIVEPKADLKSLPLPLAQLYKRCVNATSVHSKHAMAYYFWQAGLQLLAASCIVELESGLRDREHPILESLKGLACPSTGHFLQIVREVLPELEKLNSSRFKPLLDFFGSEIPFDCASIRSLAKSVNAHIRSSRDNKVKAKSQFSIRGLFDDLVTYRNDEFGHGAVDARSDGFYDRMSKLLLEGNLELWKHVSPTLHNQLIFVSEVRASEDGSWLIDLEELSDETSRQLPTIRLNNSVAHSLPLPNRVYLVPSDQDLSAVESWKSLHPLVVFEFQTQDIFFIRSRHGRSSVSYVSFVSGEHTRKAIVAEHREFMARILRIDLDQKQVDEWAAKSRQGNDDAETMGDNDPQDFLGEFKLINALGEGAMGTVYRAWQPSLQRFVAVKKLHRIGDVKARKRFQREIRALGKVDHPNLVKVFSSGTDAGTDYYSMELVAGSDLEKIINLLRTSKASDLTSERWAAVISTACESVRFEGDVKSGNDKTIGPEKAPLPHNEKESVFLETNFKHSSRRDHIGLVVVIVLQIAKAVQELHESGIIHRDIKPGNILVTQAGQAVLTDLGLAQIDQEKTITATRQFVGTIRYSSPEQVYDSSRVDVRSDVYSLGVTLWELLTLQPFLGLTKDIPTAEQFDRVRRTEVAPPSRLNTNIPSDLSTIVMKCVSKDENQRYRSAAELAEDLGRWASGDPVLAQPPSLGYYFKKYAYRYRVALALTLLAITIAVSGVVFAFVSIQTESAQRKKALEENKRLLAINHIQLGSSRVDMGIVNYGILEMVRGYKMLEPNDPYKVSAGTIINNRIEHIGNLLVHPWPVADFCFSGNSKRLLATNGINEFFLWDCEKFSLIGAPLVLAEDETQSKNVVGIGLCEEGKQLAVVKGGTITVYETMDWSVVCSIDYTECMSTWPPKIDFDGLPDIETNNPNQTVEPASEVPPAPVKKGNDCFLINANQESKNSKRIQGRIQEVKLVKDSILVLTSQAQKKFLYKIEISDSKIADTICAASATIKISQNGQFLGISNYSRADVFDIESSKRVSPSTSHPAIRGVEAGNNGRLALCFSNDHVCIWDVAFGGHMQIGQSPQDIALSDSEPRVAWLLENGYVTKLEKQPNATNLVTSQVFALRGLGTTKNILFDGSSIRGLKTGFSPGPKFVASMSSSSSIRLHDLENQKGDAGAKIAIEDEEGIRVSLYNTQESNIRFSDDGNYFAFTVGNKIRGVWHSLTTNQDSLSSWRETEIGAHLYLEKNGALIWLRPQLNKKMLKLLMNGKLEQLQKTESGNFWAAVGDSNGKYSNTFGIWDNKNNRVLFKAFNRQVRYLELANDSRLVLATFDNSNYAKNESGECRVWDFDTGESILIGRDVVFATFNQDGTLIAVSDSTGSVRIHDSKTGLQLDQHLPHVSSVVFIRFDKSGKFLACGDAAGNVFLWDLETNLPLSFPRQVIINRQGPQYKFEIGPNSKYLLSLYNSSVQVWSFNEAGLKNVSDNFSHKTRLMIDKQGNPKTLEYLEWQKLIQ